MLTAQEMIDGARLRHWSFADTVLGDGAAVLFLNQRIRTLLLRYRAQLKDLINVTIQTATTISGVLVGVDATGTPYIASTSENGYAVHDDGAGGYYLDTTDAPISLDPFGASGTSPGFALPADAIALFSIAAVFADGTTEDVEVLDERHRHHGGVGRCLPAFLSGNRLIAIRPPTAGTTDTWSTVTAVQTNYLPLPSVTALSDGVAVPAPMAEVLIADLCELFALQSPQCPDKAIAAFGAAARRAEQDLDLIAYDIVGDLQTSTIIFKG